MKILYFDRKGGPSGHVGYSNKEFSKVAFLHTDKLKDVGDGHSTKYCKDTCVMKLSKIFSLFQSVALQCLKGRKKGMCAGEFLNSDATFLTTGVISTVKQESRTSSIMYFQLDVLSKVSLTCISLQS